MILPGIFVQQISFNLVVKSRSCCDCNDTDDKAYDGKDQTDDGSDLTNLNRCSLIACCYSLLIHNETNDSDDDTYTERIASEYRYETAYHADDSLCLSWHI